MDCVSILNDVMGPVMRGPSSSHTAGAYRIGLLTKMLAGSPPASVRIAFDPDGSYAPTCKALGVDLAFAAAFLGWDMVDSRYNDGIEQARAAGIDLQFRVEPLQHADHPNGVQVVYGSTTGHRTEVWARSVGGGMVEVYRINDAPCLLNGIDWTLLVRGSRGSGDETGRLLPGAPAFTTACDDGSELTVFHSPSPFATAQFERIRSLEAVDTVLSTDPILYPGKGEAPFESAKTMLAFAEEHQCSLGQAASAYESQVLGMTEEDLRQEMLRRYQIMRASAEVGMQDENLPMSLTRPTAPGLWQALEAGRLPLGGIPTRAAIRSLAVLHSCNARGVVCAAPTGGSAGVVPGVLLTLVEEHDLSDLDIATLLFCAGGIGLIMARRATFAAEEAGCQVEIGIAGAMAAAMLVQHAGGTPVQCASAASISLQNTMGLTCDPVGGGCEIPCHTRTAAAAAGAFTTADLVLGGYTNPISLDDAIDASYEAGKALPAELRCTARGGIATKPSAQSLLRPRH